MARIFISHSSRDGEQSARMLAWLKERGFEQAFLDFDKHAGIAPGAEWERTIYREIARAEAVILVLTANWFDSKWCFAEFTQARGLGKAIFPVIESPTGETFVTPDIQHLDLVKDREGGLERLAAELTRVALNARGGFAWDGTRPPFPGLLAFDEADAAIYFGRDDDIRRLIERLNARRAQGGAKLVALLGASGSGKSSLMRAGMLPRLKHDPRNWIVVPPFRPQTYPLDELAHALALALGEKGDWRQVREALTAGDPAPGLRDLARDLRAAHRANEAQILVSVDQGEELFAAADPENAARFWDVLNAMQDESLPFLVLLGLRADYLGELQRVPGLEALEEFSLKPMPLERVRDIIEGPARIAGLTVDDSLITAAMKDAATDDALPLLAFALRELYDRFAASGALTAEAYRALGDEAAGLSPLDNAVRRKADEVLAAAKPSDEEKQALKDAFVHGLVRVNAEGEYARRPAPLDSLPPLARPLIERLTAARLLIRRELLGAATVEVAHEALLRKWPLLRGWLDEEREFLIGREQLLQDLRDWEHAPDAQKADALLTGLKLSRAASWLAEKGQHLGDAEQTFVTASLKQQEKIEYQRTRMQRNLRLAGTVAVIVLIVGAGLSLWQWQVAKGQHERAENALAAATQTANAVVVDLARRFRHQSGISVDLVRGILESAYGLLQQLAESGETRPDLGYTRASALNEIVLTLINQGDYQSALERAEQCREIMESLVTGSQDNSEWQYALSLCYHRIGDALAGSGQFEGALDVFEQSRTIRERLVEMSAHSTERRLELSFSYLKAGDMHLMIGDRHGGIEQDANRAREAYLNGLEVYLKGLAIRADLVKGDPSEEYRRELGAAYEKAGDARVKLGLLMDALDDYRNSLALRFSLLKENQKNTQYQRDLALSNERVGLVLLDLGERDEALEALHRSLSIRENLAGIDRGNALWQSDVAVSLFHLARSGYAPQEYFTRAVEILRLLQAEGKLAANHAELILFIKQSLAEL